MALLMAFFVAPQTHRKNGIADEDDEQDRITVTCDADLQSMLKLVRV